MKLPILPQLLVYRMFRWQSGHVSDIWNCGKDSFVRQPLICEIWCYLQVFTVRIKLNPRIPNWCPRIAWWCGSLLLTLKLGLRTPKSCVRLCDSVDCRLPGSSVHGILQARILEWIAIPFSRRSSWPRDQTPVSCTAGRFFLLSEPSGKPRSINK